MDYKKKISEALSERREEKEKSDKALEKEYAEALEPDLTAYICLTKGPVTLKNYLNGKKIFSDPCPHERPEYDELIDDRTASLLFEKLRDKALHDPDFYFSRDSFRDLVSYMNKELEFLYPREGREEVPGTSSFRAKNDMRELITGLYPAPDAFNKLAALVQAYSDIDSCVFSPEKRNEYKDEVYEKVSSSKEPLPEEGLCESFFGKEWNRELFEMSEKYSMSPDTVSAVLSAVSQISEKTFSSPEDFSLLTKAVGKNIFARLSENAVSGIKDYLKEDFQSNVFEDPKGPENIKKAVVWMLDAPGSGQYHSITSDEAPSKTYTPLSQTFSGMSKGYCEKNTYLFKDYVNEAAVFYLKEQVKDIPSMYAFAENIPGKNFGYACSMFEDGSHIVSYFAKMIAEQGTPEDFGFFMRETLNFYTGKGSETVSQTKEIPKEILPYFFDSVKEAFKKDKSFVFDRDKTLSVIAMFDHDLDYVSGKHKDCSLSKDDVYAEASFLLDLSLSPGYVPGIFDETCLTGCFSVINTYLSDKGYTAAEAGKIKGRIFDTVREPLLRNETLYSFDIIGSDVEAFVKETLGPDFRERRDPEEER